MLLGNMDTGGWGGGTYEHVEAETTQRDATRRTRRESGIKLWNQGHPAQKPAGCQRKPCPGELNGFPRCAEQQKEENSSLGSFYLPPFTFGPFLRDALASFTRHWFSLRQPLCWDIPWSSPTNASVLRSRPLIGTSDIDVLLPSAPLVDGQMFETCSAYVLMHGH